MKKIVFSDDNIMCDSIKAIIQESDVSILNMRLPNIGNKSHMEFLNIEVLCNTNKNKTIISTHMHDKTRILVQDKK